ncbi:MAG: Pyruvate-ferrodoxin oxidoreductase [Streblomastix strix]|uniref:Pyruvate-ferrodoxin oxidoreductase n=1 Tax=Streblomastix strix TaxID=222440 RepID=A0A5J4WYF1_9EUKA|nr:MAG: Pyruvate-ferrodoxin oxidoreductase [Streblomastix strix]
MIKTKATGYSSIWGGLAPWCPYLVNSKRLEPACVISLHEDNTEIGFGMLISSIQRCKRIIDIENKVVSSSDTPQEVKEIAQYWIANVKPIEKPHSTNDELKKTLEEYETETPLLADLYKVLDTEVYSNTKGLMIQSIPRGASVKFASSGKKTTKQNLKYFLQCKKLKRFPNHSNIIEYTPFLNHGTKDELVNMIWEENIAVKYWYWTLIREVRFDSMTKSFRKEAERLHALLVTDTTADYKRYKNFVCNEL